jgi:hypothetical protein
MLVWLTAAISEKFPDLLTWSVWYQALLLAAAGPDAASPAAAASTAAAPAIQRFITPPDQKKERCPATIDIMPFPKSPATE